MTTVFDEQTRAGLAARLAQLNPANQPLWGKMTPAQMLKHCRLWEETIQENKRYKGPLIGRLIGPLILNQVLKTPELRRNSPTIPQMLIKETDIDFDDEQGKLLTRLNNYAAYNAPDYTFIHPFFGKMTREQIGQLAYKHWDHHLRQFGV